MPEPLQIESCPVVGSSTDAAPLRILLVDDDEDDLILTRELLADVAPNFCRLDWVSNYDDALQAVAAARHDVYLVDYYLGARTGLDLLRHAQSIGCRAPIIFLTGTGGYDVDLAAMKAGAADYLVKKEITPALLERSIRYALERARNLEVLQESEARFRFMADSSPVMIWLDDGQGLCTFFNKPWLNFTGRPAEEELGLGWLEGVHPDDRLACKNTYYSALQVRREFTLEYRLRRHDGVYRWVLDSGCPLFSPSGHFNGYIGTCVDISDLKKAQSEMQSNLKIVEKSRQDVLSILNQLRLGVVMTDGLGRVTFLSDACLQLLERPVGQVVGRHWNEVCPFDAADKDRLEHIIRQPAAERRKLTVHLYLRDTERWMEVEVQDDPRDPAGRIFYLYDVSDVHDLRRQLDERGRFHELVGKSNSMQLVYQHIRELARVDSTVLIEGETGSGKELVARAIHTASSRRDKPFIAVNCAGLSDSLLGSQLFGHRRGSFTGAVEDAKGVFETADGGTVFLDEIGDVSRTVQTNLLRVLQEKEITRLGEVQSRKINVRIIAATHQNLNQEVEAGRFRLDLLYRIRVARVMLPPLRDRREDIPLLAQTFLQRFRAASGKPVQRISSEALGLLLNHDWPGNVRELQSAVEFAVIRCQSESIERRDLPPELLHNSDVGRVSAGVVSHADVHLSGEAERSRIITALEAAQGNRVEAARLLGMSRSTFYRRLDALEIEPKFRRENDSDADAECRRSELESGN